MKVIKLTRRYVLGKEGFVVGLAFGSENNQYYEMRRRAEAMFGSPWNKIWNHTPDHQWGWYRGKTRWGNNKPYIGFKSEAQLSMLLLTVKDLKNVGLR